MLIRYGQKAYAKTKLQAASRKLRVIKMCKVVEREEPVPPCSIIASRWTKQFAAPYSPATTMGIELSITCEY